MHPETATRRGATIWWRGLTGARPTSRPCATPSPQGRRRPRARARYQLARALRALGRQRDAIPMLMQLSEVSVDKEVMDDATKEKFAVLSKVVVSGDTPDQELLEVGQKWVEVLPNQWVPSQIDMSKFEMTGFINDMRSQISELKKEYYSYKVQAGLVDEPLGDDEVSSCRARRPRLRCARRRAVAQAHAHPRIATRRRSGARTRAETRHLAIP